MNVEKLVETLSKILSEKNDVKVTIRLKERSDDDGKTI